MRRVGITRITRTIVASAILMIASPMLRPAFGDSAANSSVKAETVITLRSFGPVGIGGDDTAILQRALSATSKKGQVLRIELSKVPYRVSPIYVPSNTNLVIDRGVVIQALPGFVDGQKLITIGDAQNVKITGYGSTLKMNR